MPGSGKSTLGVQIAKELGLNFIDTDLVIQNQQGQLLQTILIEKGYLALRAIEEQALLELKLHRDLISTGGSAVYSDTAMQYLSQQGTIIYLEVDYDEIQKRINNESSRGIARPDGQSLKEVYAERTPLYERYADLTINNNKPADINSILRQLQDFKLKN